MSGLENNYEQGRTLALTHNWTELFCTVDFGFLAGVSGSRISAAAPILEPGSCHDESPIGRASEAERVCICVIREEKRKLYPGSWTGW